MTPAPTGIAEVYHRRRSWWVALNIWKGIWFILLVSIAAGSAFVASELSEWFHARQMAAMIVAICSALFAVLRPEIRARASRDAWVVLERALREQKGDV